MDDKILQELPEARKDVLLKDYTTYKIGGPAKYFFIVKNKENLLKALGVAKKFKLPIFILGAGSNLLASDKGFKGFVIKIDIKDIEFQQETVRAGAGVALTKLAYLTAENGFSGLEWSSGIPGTVGGAIYGHAQAFGAKISDLIKEVEALDIKTLQLKNFSKGECQFTIKNSIFKANKDLVIISATLEFPPKADGQRKDPAEIKKLIKEFLKYRRDGHPVNFPSAGSTFVNPHTEIADENLLEKFPELKEYNKKKIVPAGYLISRCGLAGKKVGKAQISQKHANFIINLGGAKSSDVLSLIKLAKKKVKEVFKIDLEIEVQFLGIKYN